MAMVGWPRPARRLLWIFLGVTVLPTAGLLWLGWQLVSLDRSLGQAQIEDRLRSALSEAIAEMRRDLDSLEFQSATAISSVTETGAVVVQFRNEGILQRAGARLLYTSSAPAVAEPPPSTWEQGERLEAAGAADRAIAEYRTRANSKDEGIRAGALVRLARVLRTSGRADEALSVYTDLASLTNAWVFGDPAPLVARLARARMLEELGRIGEYNDETVALVADLLAVRWTVDRTTFETAWLQVGRLYADGPKVDEMSALAAGVDALRTEWMARGQDITWRGRQTAAFNGHDVLLMWRGAGDDGLGIVGTRQFFETRWADEWRQKNLQVSLVGTNDDQTAETRTSAGPVVTRTFAESGLPWTVRAVSAAPAVEFALQERRRRLVATLIGVAVFLALTGAYFVARGAGRELDAARLQADFVTAVSHELRTPITSMSHLVEILDGGRAIDEETRHRYYTALAQETGRLRRFVDRLLSLGRTQSRHVSYALEPLDAVDVVTEIVAEFRAEPAASGRPITLHIGEVSAAIQADREAIGLALHNLLENAARYSPAGTPIAVELVQPSRSGRVLVRVRDEGPGIAATERDLIFEKFARGSAAKQSGSPGTGIGLPLARQIARAHGGDITLEDSSHSGASFVLNLPASAAVAGQSIEQAPSVRSLG